MKPGVIQGDLIFDDGNGCVTQDITFPGVTNTSEFLVLYIPYFDDPHSDWALQNPNCTAEHSHNFLSIWAKSQYIENTTAKEYGNISAQFCRPTYHVRHVTATVNATSRDVFDIDNTDTPDLLLPETDFNVTNFEYLIGVGTSENQLDKPLTGDLPDVSIVEQLPRLIKFNLAWPLTNMVGYGMAASSGQTEDLADPSQMHKAFESAHKLLFSVAVAAMLVPNESTTNERTGLLIDQPGSIIFARSFSIVVEAFLAVVGVLTCVLWVVYQQRQTNMTHDPASISDIMRLVRSTKEPLHGFYDSGTLTTSMLRERLRSQRYQLNAYNECGTSEMRLKSLKEVSKTDIDNIATFRSSIDCPEQFQAIRPFELSFTTGGVVGTVIVVAITTLSYLYYRTIRFNGI